MKTKNLLLTAILFICCFSMALVTSSYAQNTQRTVKVYIGGVPTHEIEYLGYKSSFPVPSSWKWEVLKSGKITAGLSYGKCGMSSYLARTFWTKKELKHLLSNPSRITKNLADHPERQSKIINVQQRKVNNKFAWKQVGTQLSDQLVLITVGARKVSYDNGWVYDTLTVVSYLENQRTNQLCSESEALKLANAAIRSVRNFYMHK